MTFLHDLTIKKTRELLLSKKISSFDLTKEFFDFIEKKDEDIGAYISLFRDEALRQSKDVDVKIAKSEPLGALVGCPIAIKDNILVQGFPTTAGSKILENYTSSYDATVVEKMRIEDAVFVGKANMDEFAMGSSTENSAYKITRNPVDLSLVPGGSSGGSVAAVAAHEAVASLGSETGGSVRQPASFCGIVGLKPTYGAVSRYGLIAMASSLDQIGPATKTVEDCAILFKTIAGKDVFDSTSVEIKQDEDLLSPNYDSIKQFTVGIPKEYFQDGLDEDVQKAVDGAIASIKSLGLKIKEISLPHTQYAIAVYYIIMPAEVSANLARFDGIRYSRSHVKEAKKLIDFYKKQRNIGFGNEPKRRILLGAHVLSSGYYDAYYGRAQKVRQLIRQDFDNAFSEVDIILTPTAPSTAFKLGEKTEDPLAMYLSDVFTCPANLAGVPAISIPVRDIGPEALPVGFQLIGKHFHESDILGLGMLYEKLFLEQ